MRLWRSPAHVSRNPLPVAQGGDFVSPGLYSFQTLGLTPSGGEITLYLEAVRSTAEPGGSEIQVELVALGADAGADGPAEEPSDLVVVTTTEIEIYGRGRDDNRQYLSSIIWATTLEILDEEEGEEPLPPDSSILPGGLSVHQVRVIDPRQGLSVMQIDGQAISLLADGQGGYVTPEFLAINPDTPLDALNPSGLPLIRLSGGLTAILSYNPSGKQKTGNIKKLPPAYKKVASLINDDIIPAMQSANWTPTNPNNPGEFGSEVHRRLAAALQGNQNYLCNMIVHPQTLVVIGYGAQGMPGMAQIDVMHVQRGYHPAMNDILDLSKVKMAFEVKSGLSGLSSSQIEYYPGIFGGQGTRWDLVRSRTRWVPGIGGGAGSWMSVPIMNDEMPKLSKYLKGANAIGPGLVLGSMLVHGFYGKDERDLAVRQAVDALDRAATASSQGIVLDKSLEAFEHLQTYFSSFSGGNGAVTMGLVHGILDFIKRNT